MALLPFVGLILVGGAFWFVGYAIYVKWRERAERQGNGE